MSTNKVQSPLKAGTVHQTDKAFDEAIDSLNLKDMKYVRYNAKKVTCQHRNGVKLKISKEK